MPDLVNILEKETGGALPWLGINEMIANPDPFRAILLKKNQADASRKHINIDGIMMKSEQTVKFPGVTFGYNFDFDPYISALDTLLQN